MAICLRYGDRFIRLDGIGLFATPPVVVPPAWARAERTQEMAHVAEPSQGRSPLGEVPGGLADRAWVDACLEKIPDRARSIVLVVPDATRAGCWSQALRLLLPAVNAWARAAHQGGTRDLTLLVAGGVHAVLARDRLLRHLLPGDAQPEKALEGWRVIQNGDNGFRDHIPVGETGFGTPVRLHPAYVRADWKMLLGEVSYHYFAGFGGGRKLVFPGLGEPAGIAVNHRRALRLPAGKAGEDGPRLDEIEWEPACAPGRLAGNPVHLDLDEAAALARPDWVMTALEEPPTDPDPALAPSRRLRIEQGPYPGAVDRVSAGYDAVHRVCFTTAPDLLIADAGGTPRDSTFLQAHKSLQHGARFLPKGGALLLVASCREGIGSVTLSTYAAGRGESSPGDFRPLAGAGSDPVAALHVQTLVAFRRAVAWARVGLWSELPAEMVAGLGMEPLADEEQALAFCRSVQSCESTASRGSARRPANAGAEVRTAGAASPARPRRDGFFWGWLPRAERFLPADGWLGGGLEGTPRPRKETA